MMESDVNEHSDIARVKPKRLKGAMLRAVFELIVNRPWPFILIGSVMLVLGVVLASTLEKDTRSDAFLAEDNPALVYRQQVKDLFGLRDPLVVALVINQDRQVKKTTIFQPEVLSMVSKITTLLEGIENVDPDRIMSLATEKNIKGTKAGMEVKPFYKPDTLSLEQASLVQQAIREFPLYQGRIVSHDESATLIVAELMDDALAEISYKKILYEIEQLELPSYLSIHVAGEGAISGYLGSYIDADAKRLNPIAGLVISIIVFIAFLRFSPVISSLFIIGASVLISIGIMAVVSVPFYVITNALPVILIGISVADTIHIYSEYFERRVNHTTETIKDSIVESLMSIWRPITLTTLTTASGFLGLYLAAYMPPFKYFGLFAALGVGVALLYSLFFLPALMSVFQVDVHPYFAKKIHSHKKDIFSEMMVFLGVGARRYARALIVVSMIVIGLGGVAASHLVVNDDRIETFSQEEPLYIADKVINERFDGSSYLDIVIETSQTEGLFEPAVLQKMQQLQVYAESLEGVQGTVSIVDYLKQMNRALNGGERQAYRLPDDGDLVAQYLLLYSASSEPTDFEEEIDYEYQNANIRLSLNSAAYVNIKGVVESLDTYIQEQFNTYDEFENLIVKATLSGRVNLNYHWLKDLGKSHFFGVAIALLLVFIVSAILFRSLFAGLYTLLPVVVSILIIYASMVLLNIPLGIGTSMFAAVAIGLGVDFSIHTIDRIRSLYQQTQDIDSSLSLFYPATGRALLFNLLAIALGFGVLVSSQVVPLNAFGGIVVIAVTTSFIVSMTLLPALIKVFQPVFIKKYIH